MNDFTNTPPSGQSGFNPSSPVYNQTQSSYGQTGVNRPPKPDNYLVMSIIATVIGFCSCLPLILGIVSIIFSTQVDSKYNMGDYAGAESASKTAQILSIISLVLAILGIVGTLVYYLVVGVAAFADLV